MPPEQVLGEDIDGRADLYAVGVMFYRLLTGTLPFKADNAIVMLQRQVADAPPPVHVQRDDLPSWCGAILERALAKSPDDRFQSAEEFRAALGHATGMAATMDLAKALAVLPADPSPAPAPLATEKLAVSRAADGTPETATPVVPRARPRRRIRPLTLAVAAIVLVALAVFVRGSRDRTPAAIPVTAAPPHPARAEPIAVPPMPTEGATPPAPARMFPVPVTFPVKTFGRTADGERERDAELVLADGRVNVIAGDNSQDPLHSVPYEDVLSISYSRTRHPMWNSPRGPVPIVRASGGALGIFFERHWVSLRTNTPDRFIVLRFGDEALAKKVLGALEERTGRKAQLVTERRRKNDI
jgi:hypothetical protein